jgi:hypothetical protein
MARVALETNTGIAIRFVEFESDIPDNYSWARYDRQLCTHKNMIRLIANQVLGQSGKSLVLSKYNEMTKQLYSSIANSATITAKNPQDFDKHVKSVNTIIMSISLMFSFYYRKYIDSIHTMPIYSDVVLTQLLNSGIIIHNDKVLESQVKRAYVYVDVSSQRMHNQKKRMIDVIEQRGLSWSSVLTEWSANV